LVQPVVDHFDRQVIGQQSLVDRFRFLSPAIATQAALNDLAGASVSRYRHFLTLVDEFHQTWKSYFNPRIVRKATLGADDYDRFPTFALREEPSGEVARRVSIGLIGLLLPTLVIGWLALRALRRYPLTG
jgi:ABC-2 type transport system permease protein